MWTHTGRRRASSWKAAPPSAVRSADETGKSASGSKAAKLDTLTIAPRPALLESGVTSRAMRTTFISTMSRPRCQSPSGMARRSPLGG